MRFYKIFQIKDLLQKKMSTQKDSGEPAFKSYDFCIKFSKKMKKSQLDYLIELLKKHKIKHYLPNEEKTEGIYYLFLAIDEPQMLLREAGNLSIYKKHTESTGLMGQMMKQHQRGSVLFQRLETLSKKHRDPASQKTFEKVEELEKYKVFTFEKRGNFLPAEDVIAKTIGIDKKELEEVTEAVQRPAGKKKSTLLKTLISSNEKKPDNNGKEQSHPVKAKDEEDFSRYLQIFTSAELLKIRHSIISKLRFDKEDSKFIELFDSKRSLQNYPSSSVIDILTRKKYIEVFTPLHDDKLIEKVNLQTESIVDYFGEEVAMYFEYMKHYRDWLKFPAISGLIIFMLRYFGYIESNDSPLAAVYAFIVVIWATLYIIYWRKRSNELTTLWHSYSKHSINANQRPEFKGETRINLVTDLPELHFSKKKLYFNFFKSALYSLPLLFVTFVVVFICLNISEYVTSETILYMPFFARLSEQGGIFDSTTWRFYIPTIIQVLAITLLNSIYENVSYETTVAENHRTQQAFDDSLILKRFAFKFTSYFLYLFYIAFWRFDVGFLEMELTTIFCIDEIRRVMTETVLPYVLKEMRGHKLNICDEEYALMKLEEQREHYIQKKISEVNCPEYVGFNEYIEMVFQFGYVSFFASVFPLAALLSIGSNSIELRSDFFKIKTSYRRPFPQHSAGIGSWFPVLKAMSIIAVTTNTIIVTFSGGGLLKSVMSVINGTGWANGRDFSEKNYENLSYAVTLFILLEHFLLLLLQVLWYMIPEMPAWVEVYRKRKTSKTRLFS